jgi:hypothetical protein
VGLIAPPGYSYRFLCVWLNVIMNPRQRGGLGSLEAVASWLRKLAQLNVQAPESTPVPKYAGVVRIMNCLLWLTFYCIL